MNNLGKLLVIVTIVIGYSHTASSRYIQSDPIGIADGPNTYVYAHSNPLNEVDPTGQFGIPGALIGGGIDLTTQLIQNNGDLDCVNWGSVVTSAGLGAIGGGLANGLVKGAFKVRVARSIGGRSPSYSWGATKAWGTKNNIKALRVTGNQQRHHWLLQQNQGWGRNAPNWIKNQPWNVNPVPASFNGWMSRGATNLRSLLGAPSWARGVAGGSVLAGAGAVAGRGNNCDCP